MQIKPADDDKPVKKIKVKLLRGYFPADPDWPQNPEPLGGPVKARRGMTIELPIDEARRLVSNGLAERTDQPPL